MLLLPSWDGPHLCWFSDVCQGRSRQPVRLDLEVLQVHPLLVLEQCDSRTSCLYVAHRPLNLNLNLVQAAGLAHSASCFLPDLILTLSFFFRTLFAVCRSSFACVISRCVCLS